jgi:serine/threonine-protein kinase
VPAVKGFTLTQAFSMLADAQLKADPHFIYSGANENTVTAQAPKAGKIVLVGTKVRINISRGLKPLSVPSVIGQPYVSAQNALRGGGFSVTRAYVDSESPQGQVVAQDPLAGAQVPQGTTITLSVSKGPQLFQVPDVTGQAQADAEALLADAGFRSTVQTQDVTDPANDGLVLSQLPQGGTVVKKGSVVNLVVGHLTAPPPEPVPPPPPAVSTPAAAPPPADELGANGTTADTSAADAGAANPTATETSAATTTTVESLQGAPASRAP